MAATSRLSSPFWGETTCIGLVQLLRKCARQAVPMRRLRHSPASSLMVISPSAPLASLLRDKALRPCLLGVIKRRKRASVSPEVSSYLETCRDRKRYVERQRHRRDASSSAVPSRNKFLVGHSVALIYMCALDLLT